MTSLQSFTFLVKDEVDGPHRVTFVRHDSGHLSTDCTCPEHRNAGGCCAHGLRLLAGDTSDLVSDNAVEVEVLEWWLTCMDMKQVVSRVRTAQAEGRMPLANVSSVVAHWPDLTDRDFLEPDRVPARRRGAA